MYNKICEPGGRDAVSYPRADNQPNAVISFKYMNRLLLMWEWGHLLKFKFSTKFHHDNYTGA